MPSKADLKEADREKRRLALLEEIGSETPFPDGRDDLKNKSSRWKDVNWTNVHNVKKIIASLALEDLPKQTVLEKDGGKGNRAAILTYVRFLIQDHATGKRKAKIALEKAEKKARGACDLLFADDDQPTREAKWRAVLFKDGKVTMPTKTFEARAGNTNGCQAFHRALKAEERAATLTKAKADGDVRQMTREVKPPDAWQPGQPNDGAMPFGEGTEDMRSGWSIGDEGSEYIISVVEEAAKRRGVSLDDIGVEVARVLLTTRSSREQKLRRVGMTNNARSVTKALTTIRDLGLLGVKAGERASSWLVAELREAPTDAPDVVVLGDMNRGDVLECLTTCGDAPSVGFGAAAGGVLGGGAASRGGLRLGRVGAARRSAAAVSASAPASLRVALRDWEKQILARVSRLKSASREQLVTAMTDTDAAAVARDHTSPTFLVELARGASRNLDNVLAINAALDERELHETPGGEMAQLLLKWGLMGLDPLTGKGVAGGFISTCEEIDEEESRKKGEDYRGAKCRFYAPKILHLALQKALLSGKLHFEDDLLTLFYCVFGKLFYALTFWAGDITMLEAQDMGFDLTVVPMELRPKDVKKMPASIAKRFPKGIVIESSDHLYEILTATNDSFFDEGKCFLWALAFAAYYGVGHPRARAALAAVAAYEKDHKRAALRVSACEKAIDALATGGGAAVSAVGAGACGDVLATAPAPYVPFPSLRAALDAAKTPFKFKLRFAVPAKGRGAPLMGEWADVDDLVPVCAALASSRDWNGVRSNHSWVFGSATYRVMEAAACASSAVFAGMDLTEIAAPHSVLEVFDPTIKCKHDQTYTIWAGVDFEIMLPGGRVISKSEFLLQELEKYMAARA